MLRVSLQVDGIAQFDRAFSRFSEGLKDLRPLWEPLAQEFYRIEDEQFASEGAHSGNPWKPLSPKYQQWKEKHIPGPMILELTNKLKLSLTYKGNSAHVRQEDLLTLTLGSSLPYAKYHQTGTRRMPARKPIDLSEDHKAKLGKIIHRGLVKIARKVGFETEEGFV